MSIVTCTAKTRNDLSVARIVIEVLAQSWGYKCSVTYNEGKSFDVMVPAGAESNAILKFKRLAPDLDIYKSDKKAIATAQTESRRRMKKERRTYFDSEVVKMSWGELPDDVQNFIGNSSDWENADIDTRYEWIADGIERNHIYSVEFDTMDDYWSDKTEESTEESRKLRRKSESRRRMKRESAFKSLSQDDRYEYADAGNNAEILHSDIGEFIYEPGSDFTEGREITDAYLIDDDYNTSDFTKDGDHREEAEKISKMSFEDAVRYCKENGWKSY